MLSGKLRQREHMVDRTDIVVRGSLLDSLSEEFFWEEGGFSDFQAEPGVAYSLVARVSGLSMVIWADEHPPPHFHVRYQGEDASFSILECRRLAGTQGLERYERRIRGWWESHKFDLIQKWNEMRPADCPVGPI
ncbi:DUF4160 domain-containing protein [Bradyrhizobium sp. USDA 10063]